MKRNIVAYIIAPKWAYGVESSRKPNCILWNPWTVFCPKPRCFKLKSTLMKTQIHSILPTLFVIPSKWFWGLHIYSVAITFTYQVVFSPKSSTKISHHKLLPREGRVLTNGWTHPWSMTISFHLFIRIAIQKSYHSDKKYLMTLNIIFGVVWSCGFTDNSHNAKSWSPLYVYLVQAQNMGPSYLTILELQMLLSI